MSSYKSIILLTFAICLSQFCSGIYAPSIPYIAKQFHYTKDQIEFTMYIYMFSLAISQLIYGPLSEGIGRKKPMLIGLSIILFGNIMCIFPSIKYLILGRFIQGLGAGSCTALWRPIFRDLFKNDDDLIKISSYLTIFITFIIPSAPLIGGYLQIYFGWQSSFIFMFAYTLFTWIIIKLWFKESNPNYCISNLKINYVKAQYLKLFKCNTFMGVSLSVLFTYGTFFIWYVISPYLLINELGISPIKFGWLIFFANGSAALISGWLNGKYIKKIGIINMLKLGWILTFSSGIMLCILVTLFKFNVYTIMLPMFVFYFGADFIWPNAFTKAFAVHRGIAGYAGSLYSFMQVCGAALLPSLISFLPHHDPRVFGLIIIITSIMSYLIFIRIVIKR